MIRINLNITIVDMVVQKKLPAINLSLENVEGTCLNENNAISVMSFSNESVFPEGNGRRAASLERMLLQRLNVSGTNRRDMFGGDFDRFSFSRKDESIHRRL